NIILLSVLVFSNNTVIHIIENGLIFWIVTDPGRASWIYLTPLSTAGHCRIHWPEPPASRVGFHRLPLPWYFHFLWIFPLRQPIVYGWNLGWASIIQWIRHWSCSK